MSKYLMQSGFCYPEDRKYNLKGELTCLLIMLTYVASSPLILVKLRFCFTLWKKSPQSYEVDYTIYSTFVNELHASVTGDQRDKYLFGSAYQEGKQEQSGFQVLQVWLSLSIQGREESVCTLNILSSLQLRSCMHSF